MSAEPVQVEIVEQLARAQSLEPEWSELWERCPYVSAFQLPAWVLGSWRHFSAGQPRALLAARHAEQLVALLPLRLAPEEITLEGTEVSDYLDVLIDPRHRADSLKLLLSKIAQLAGQRRLRFERLTWRSPLLTVTEPDGWRPNRTAQDVCPYVAVSKPAAGLRGELPAGFFRRLEQVRRAANRHFSVEAVAVSSTDAVERLEILFKLHTERWSERCQAGVFADPATRGFHLQVVPQLIARDRAWLLELLFDGAPAASLLALHGHGRALYYIGGFDLRYAAFSPGRLLIAALFERALARGYAEVDFLRGVERYKYDWGARNRNTVCLTMEPTEARVCATG